MAINPLTTSNLRIPERLAAPIQGLENALAAIPAAGGELTGILYQVVC